MEMEMQKIFCGIKKNETKHDISLDPPSLIYQCIFGIFAGSVGYKRAEDRRQSREAGSHQGQFISVPSHRHLLTIPVRENGQLALARSESARGPLKSDYFEQPTFNQSP